MVEVPPFKRDMEFPGPDFPAPCEEASRGPRPESGTAAPDGAPAPSDGNGAPDGPNA